MTQAKTAGRKSNGQPVRRMSPADRADLRLACDYLVVFGLGERRELDQRHYQEGLRRMFSAADRLGLETLALALPGRVEEHCDTADAIEWFLPSYEAHGAGRTIHLIESTGAQKAMLRAEVPATPL